MATLNSPNNALGFALRDYHHAAKTFTTEPGYTKTPYTGFSFHVNISFNSILGFLGRIETKNISVLIKAADLPETQFETEVLNQYNRKRIINKRVNYQPIKIELHDDIANNVRNMWIAYNQHYNADSKYTFSSSWSIDDVYQNYSLNRRYGLDNGNSLPFINKIEIFSLGNNEYSKMLLVNPVINSAAFDDHDYSESAKTMSLRLTIDYENVIYSTGTTNQISNFGENNPTLYDQNYSSLNSQSILPQAQLAPAGSQIKTDTPTISVPALSQSQLDALNVDAVAGNVKKSNNNSNVTPDYNDTKKKVVAASIESNKANSYIFPDSTAVETTSNLSTNIIGSSQNLTSNGNSISSSNVDSNNNTGINVNSQRSSVYQTAVSQDLPETLVSPKMPSNLSAAEQALFTRLYPPLPSTDNRVLSSPYV